MFVRQTMLILLLHLPLAAENSGLFSVSHNALSAGTVSLTGLWESFPGKIIHPDSLPETAPELWRLPGTWNGSGTGEAKPTCATYRSRIAFGTMPPESLMFACMEQQENYRFYVNGELVLQDGVPAERAENAQPSARYRNRSYRVQTDTLTCVLQVSAYHYTAQAGPVFPILMGYPENMRLRFVRLLSFYAIILGILLILGAQHLVSFATFPGERGYLYFSLYCLGWNRNGIRVQLPGNCAGQRHCSYHLSCR